MSDKFDGLEREDVAFVYAGQILVFYRTFTVLDDIRCMINEATT